MAGNLFKKKRGIAFVIMIVAFSLMAVISGAIVVLQLVKSSEEAQAMAELSATIGKITDISHEAGQMTPSLTAGPSEASSTEPVMLSQFVELYAQNTDMFGWISIDDTVLNYPVMHTPDEPEKYLHTAFDGTYAISGVPFMGADCSIECSNYIIFGHNMKDGTMFRSIIKYADSAYWEQHPVIHFNTLYEQGDYEVVAAFFSRVFYQDETSVFRFYDCVDLTTRTVFDEFVENVQSSALYDTGTECKYGDSFITLITCTYHTENGRFVVVARKRAAN